MELLLAVNTPATIYRDSAAAEDEILAGVVSEADRHSHGGNHGAAPAASQVTSSSARPWVRPQTLTTNTAVTFLVEFLLINRLW